MYASLAVLKISLILCEYCGFLFSSFCDVFVIFVMVLQVCRDALMPAPSLALTVYENRQSEAVVDVDRVRLEFAPGMPKDMTIKACLAEIMSEGLGAASYAGLLLETLALEIAPVGWHLLAEQFLRMEPKQTEDFEKEIYRRASLAAYIVTALEDCEGQEDGGIGFSFCNWDQEDDYCLAGVVIELLNRSVL